MPDNRGKVGSFLCLLKSSENPQNVTTKGYGENNAKNNCDQPLPSVTTFLGNSTANNAANERSRCRYEDGDRQSLDQDWTIVIIMLCTDNGGEENRPGEQKK